MAEVTPEHHLERDRGRRRQRLRFFAPTAEQKRVAAFQPDNLLPLTRFLDQERIDFILFQGMRARFFPGINDLRRVRRPLQHVGIAEIIINDHFGLFDQLSCAQGNQTRDHPVPRPPDNNGQSVSYPP